jgi:hypothetical protein
MRAAIESLLRARKLDVTLTVLSASGEPAVPLDAARVAPTTVDALDPALGGGLRRGHLSDIVGAPSSGRTAIVVRALAAAAARGEAVALVDTCDTFDPASAAAHDLPLAHLLWVRGDGDPLRALKAFSLILQAGGFGVVVLDVAGVAPALLRRFPATTWMRLARMIEGSETVALLVAAERLARSAGGATIACGTASASWRGSAHRARVFTGLEATPRVVGGRGAGDGSRPTEDACRRAEGGMRSRETEGA